MKKFISIKIDVFNDSIKSRVDLKALKSRIISNFEISVGAVNGRSYMKSSNNIRYIYLGILLYSDEILGFDC